MNNVIHRENQHCNCGHKRMGHSSHGAQGFIGLGAGPCGYCGCEEFEERKS